MPTHPFPFNRGRTRAIVLVSIALAAAGCHQAHSLGTLAPVVRGEPITPIGDAVKALAPNRTRPATSHADASAQSSATRVEDLIAGRRAGVQVRATPTGGFAIRFSGASAGGGDPLYLVDGAPVHVFPGGGLEGVQLADIARIDLLKGDVEAAIYGMRGSNGVVLVTTKKGEYRR